MSVIGIRALFEIAQAAENVARAESFYECASAEGFDIEDTAEDEVEHDLESYIQSQKSGTHVLKCGVF